MYEGQRLLTEQQ